MGMAGLPVCKVSSDTPLGTWDFSWRNSVLARPMILGIEVVLVALEFPNVVHFTETGISIAQAPINRYLLHFPIP